MKDKRIEIYEGLNSIWVKECHRLLVCEDLERKKADRCGEIKCINLDEDEARALYEWLKERFEK